jgi:LysR family hydrogen peroxide-inducible transcriptional activator
LIQLSFQRNAIYNTYQMNLRDLRYVVAVARERNFRRAAERSFVSQPALSLAIQKLEDELGVRIFERSKVEVSVTPVGETIVAQAQRALEEVDLIKALAKQGRDQLAGSIKLGAIFTIGPYLLPELIPALHRRAPQMPLEVEENTTANLAELLRNGRVDAVVAALPFDVPGVELQPLYDEPFAVVVPKSHRWAKRRRIEAAELSGEKVLLLSSGHCFSNQVVEACPQLQQRGSETMQGNSLETLRNMVASGFGITVLPSSALGARYRSTMLQVIPFAPPAPSRRVVLAWRRSFARERAIAALVEAIGAVRIAGIEKL